MPECREYDAAVIEEATAAKHDRRFVTFSGTAASFAFVLLAIVTTQVDVIRSGLPFTEDPYDVITWFALIGIAVVGGATIVRWMGHRSGTYDPAVARRIAIGAAIATVVVTVAVLSDLLALVLVGAPRGSAGFGIAMALLVLAGANALLGLAAIWRGRSSLRRAPPRIDPEPDLIDEVGAIVGAVGARGAAVRFGTWVERSPMSPRRHRIAVGVVGALVAGIAAIIWHAFREGAWASPAAALLFGRCLEPLRLVRSPQAD